MTRYALVPKAQEDLQDILDYIAEDSLDAALKVRLRFEEVFELLGDNPGIGHYREDLSSRPIRFFPVYSYLVLYLANTMPVQIVRVLGGARDVESLLN